MLFNLINLLTLSSPNMNGNVYDYSNPNIFSKNRFPTSYEQINSSYEYFDVTSHPITSRYGDVFWTMMPHVTLSEEITERFSNKLMAIVGYETDMFFPNGDRVPITWAYNHHYCAYLRGDGTEMLQVNQAEEEDRGQYNHGFHRLWKVNETYPMSSLFFSEANGGEFRQSFHGYPRNYAQLIRSPRYFDLQPMQIDTRNRDPRYINQSKFVPGILPRESTAPSDATYSGLLECPCTTRINKTINHAYDISLDHSCLKNIVNYSVCLEQARLLGGNYRGNISVIHNSSYPGGCFYRRDLNGYLNGVYFNQNNSNYSCGGNYGEYYAEIFQDSVTNITVQMNMTNSEFVLTLVGNSENWFGIAFGAHTMADLPYSIIVDGYESVFEQKLGNHDQGHLLKSSITVQENSVINGVRTVKIIRNNVGVNPNYYYSFSPNSPNIPVLLAVGSTPGFKYHKFRGTNNLFLSAVEGNTCICDVGTGGKINGLGFSKNCRPEPYGDLIQDHNPSCFIEPYQGGLSCCHHKNVLLDADQIQPSHEMTYSLRFRFWFQEYYGQRELERFYYQTEAYSGEYDVTQCEKGTPPEDCIHSITARFQGRDMVNHQLIKNSKGFKLIYVAPHCHAATCIDMELYDSDTGNLICRVVGEMGKGTNAAYDEEGYIKLNPCLFGEDEGLLEPQIFRWDSNFTSIKRANNTYTHYGEMASWQMRGIIV
jgi:hypothetical protein